jgi:hypothetical protein
MSLGRLPTSRSPLLETLPAESRMFSIARIHGWDRRLRIESYASSSKQSAIWEGSFRKATEPTATDLFACNAREVFKGASPRSFTAASISSRSETLILYAIRSQTAFLSTSPENQGFPHHASQRCLPGLIDVSGILLPTETYALAHSSSRPSPVSN